MKTAEGHDFLGKRMSKLRPIAAVLLSLAFTVPFCATAQAEPLEREECNTLKNQKRTLLTPTVSAALKRGPDWVKEHLHDQEKIEQVRKYLQVEEKVAFRCRTNGVRIPKPLPPSLPDRKPPVPTYTVAVIDSTSLIPLRNPSRKMPDKNTSETIEAVLAADEGTRDMDEPKASAEGAPVSPQDEATPSNPSDTATGTSQAMAESDKTPPSDNEATQ